METVREIANMVAFHWVSLYQAFLFPLLILDVKEALRVAGVIQNLHVDDRGRADRGNFQSTWKVEICAMIGAGEDFWWPGFTISLPTSSTFWLTWPALLLLIQTFSWCSRLQQLSVENQNPIYCLRLFEHHWSLGRWSRNCWERLQAPKRSDDCKPKIVQNIRKLYKTELIWKLLGLFIICLSWLLLLSKPKFEFHPCVSLGNTPKQSIFFAKDGPSRQKTHNWLKYCAVCNRLHCVLSTKPGLWSVQTYTQRAWIVLLSFENPCSISFCRLAPWYEDLEGFGRSWVDLRMWNFPGSYFLLLSCLLLTSRVRKNWLICQVLQVLSLSKSQEVGGLEPFSAGLAVGGGMVLSALWSGREVYTMAEYLESILTIFNRFSSNFGRLHYLG